VRRTGGSTVRPLLAGPDRAEKYKALMDARVPLYRRVATMRVNTNRRNPGAVVRHIVTRLEKSAPPATAKPATPAPNRPRRRRRPPWRRDAAKAQQEPDGAPTPAMMAARRMERTPDPDSDTTLEKNT
jgi:shikimate kinase